MDERNQTLEEFTQGLAAQLQASMDRRYGIHVEPEPHVTLKTNGEKQALTVRFADSRIAPTIYTEDLYKDYQSGEDISEIAERISESVYAAHTHSPEIPELTIDGARQHITLTLVNTEQNRQLLERVPNFQILDGELSAIPRWYLSDDASFVVNNEMAAQMQLTQDEVLRIGQQHIDSQHYTAQSMQEVLGAMMGDDMIDMFPPMEGPQMIILSSENRIQGSSALLSEEALHQVHDMIGDYTVLPSSIHEVICIPADESMNPDELRAMVREINMTQVAPEERLSDQVMHYDGNKLRIVGDSLKMETPIIEEPKMASHTMKMAM